MHPLLQKLLEIDCYVTLKHLGEAKLWATISHKTVELFYQKLYRDIHKGYSR